MEFECKDIGNQNCGFKAEANTQDELITKVNQHVRSAHGMNPTDSQDKVERAIKEREGGRGSSSTKNSPGSSFQSGTQRQGLQYAQPTSRQSTQSSDQQGQQNQYRRTATSQESNTAQRDSQTGTSSQKGPGKNREEPSEFGQGQNSGMTTSTSNEKQYGSSTSNLAGQRGRGATNTSEDTSEEDEEE